MSRQGAALGRIDSTARKQTATSLAGIGMAAGSSLHAVEWRLQAAMRGAAPTSGPERGLLALSLAGWIGLATVFSRGEIVPFCATGGWGDRVGASLEVALTTGAIQDGFLHWAMMVAAMMSPLLMPPLRHVAGRSFRRRRARAISAFLVGYGAVWMVAGAAFALMNIGLRAAAVTLTAGQAILLFGLAIAWQLSDWRAAALRRCHRTRAIAAVGVRADRSCARYGISHGSACVATCWTVMAGVMLAEASLALPLALAATALLFLERASSAPRPWARAAMLAPVAVGLLARQWS